MTIACFRQVTSDPSIPDTALETEHDQRPPFLWGVATSAYQSEGGLNGKGQPRTNWSRAEERHKVEKVGTAADFLLHYQEDFARCRAMGLNAFRLSLSWTRIQPSFDRRDKGIPKFDDEALANYARIIAACRDHGMEPVITLHHFTHPEWLGPDPWLGTAVIPHFLSFIRHTLTRINELLVDQYAQAPLATLITINEPNMLVLNTYITRLFPARKHRGLHNATTATDRLLEAHIRSYNQIHDLYAARGWPQPQVTFNTFCNNLYWEEKFLYDLIALRENGIPLSEDKADSHIRSKAQEFESALADARIPLPHNLPYYAGVLLKMIANRIATKRFTIGQFPGVLKALAESPRTRVIDYIAIDYYDPFTEHLLRMPVLRNHEFKSTTVRAWMLNSVTSKWWDWRVLPQGMGFFCDYYSCELGGLPVMIAENGMALRRTKKNRTFRRDDGISRSEFLRLHVGEIQRLVKAGVPIIGYLHWSLFDNYEWGSYTPRFGLYTLDYARGTKRLDTDHHGDRPSQTYRDLIAEARRHET